MKGSKNIFQFVVYACRRTQKTIPVPINTSYIAVRKGYGVWCSVPDPLGTLIIWPQGSGSKIIKYRAGSSCPPKKSKIKFKKLAIS